MTITLTLADIREHEPCPRGWARLLSALGEPKRKPDLGRVIGLGDVLIANGLQDAHWCLRAIRDPRQRVSLVMPAVKRASAHTTDARVHYCIAELDRWLAGDDTVDLRAAARAAKAARAAAVLMAAKAAAVAAASAAEAAAQAVGAVRAAAWASAAEAWAVTARASMARAEKADILRLSPPLWLIPTDARGAVE